MIERGKDRRVRNDPDGWYARPSAEKSINTHVFCARALAGEGGEWDNDLGPAPVPKPPKPTEFA